MTTLADLIETLGACDGTLPVMLDGTSGLGVISWRGDYKQASIDHGSSSFAATWRMNTEHGFAFEEPVTYAEFEPAATVADLLAILRAVLGGAGLNGYKGGVYVASPHSTVWADPWGDYNSRAVSGIECRDGAVHLSTAMKDEW